MTCESEGVFLLTSCLKSSKMGTFLLYRYVPSVTLLKVIENGPAVSEMQRSCLKPIKGSSHPKHMPQDYLDIQICFAKAESNTF